MAKKCIRVGLAGYGRIAELFHYRFLCDSPLANLVAVADVKPAALAKACAQNSSIRPYSDYRYLLEAADIDAIVTCLPTDLHADCAVSCFECGKHLYLEKPIATDLTDAFRVFEAWQASGLIGSIGFNFRFHQQYRSAAQVISSGQIGQPFAVRSLVSSAPRQLPEWRRLKIKGGGVLLDLASHHIDLSRYLFREEVTSVTAVAQSVRTEQDLAFLALTLENGLIQNTMASSILGKTDRFEIYGENGMLVVDRFGYRKALLKNRVNPERFPSMRTFFSGMATQINRIRASFFSMQEPSYAMALTNFFNAIISGTNRPPTILDGYRSLEIIDAAEESILIGSSVSVRRNG